MLKFLKRTWWSLLLLLVGMGMVYAQLDGWDMDLDFAERLAERRFKDCFRDFSSEKEDLEPDIFIGPFLTEYSELFRTFTWYFPAEDRAIPYAHVNVWYNHEVDKFCTRWYDMPRKGLDLEELQEASRQLRAKRVTD